MLECTPFRQQSPGDNVPDARPPSVAKDAIGLGELEVLENSTARKQTS